MVRWSRLVSLGGLEHHRYVLCVSHPSLGAGTLAQNILLLVTAEVQQCKWKCFFKVLLAMGLFMPPWTKQVL